jgi:hypothetical protein
VGSVMFLAKRPSWLFQISRRCVFHTVTWIVSLRQVQYCSNSCSTGDATPGTPGRLSELFWPVQVHVSGLIVQALERGRFSDSVELELDRLHVNLDPLVVNRVLRGLSDSDTAVQFYWWAESRPGFDHTQFAIAYIVSMLFLDGNFALLSFLGKVSLRSQPFFSSHFFPQSFYTLSHYILLAILFTQLFYIVSYFTN